MTCEQGLLRLLWGGPEVGVLRYCLNLLVGNNNFFFLIIGQSLLNILEKRMISKNRLSLRRAGLISLNTIYRSFLLISHIKSQS